uniref:hypothetical protein n=1 Tax=Enterococcus mundtii TaxID=53346 RepID=UPI0035C6998B
MIVVRLLLYLKLRAFTLNKLIMDAGYKTPTIGSMHFSKADAYFPLSATRNESGLFPRRTTMPTMNIMIVISVLIKILLIRQRIERIFRIQSNPEECKIVLFYLLVQIQKIIQSNHQTYLGENNRTMCEKYVTKILKTYTERKETIERIFGTAKEFHGLRYTDQIGIEKCT